MLIFGEYFWSKIWSKRMLHVKFPVISHTQSLENKIDLFHDKMIEAAAVFHRSVRVFLEAGVGLEYKKINRKIKSIEHDADTLRRDIENDLYSQNLLPNLQADILQLIEGLDKINNQIDDVIYKFYIERQEIPAKFHRKLIELCDCSADCAENLAIASRAFFKDLSKVRDYSLKVYIAEQESDQIYNDLKKSIFNSDMELANKLQLDLLVTEAADIADIAEDCADELLIFTLKRDI